MPLTSQSRVKADDTECPFHKLPNELICSIFESTCTDNLLQEYPWQMDSRPTTESSSPVITYLPALAISAVCTHWRSLALASPHLWSQLRLEITSQRGCISDLQGGFILTLQLYLDRSADSPLRIDIETDGGSSVIQSNPTALNLLLDHCPRWQRFSYTGNPNLMRCFSQHLSFPILEDLSLGRYTLIQMPRLRCFTYAPNLRVLKVDFVYKETSLPWNQLTSLDVRLLDFATIYLCRNLTTLIIRSYLSPSLTEVSLTRLRSLTLALSGGDSELGSVLNACTFSSLGELIIAPSFSENLVWPVHAFDAFISRSSCILTRLSIRGVKIGDLDLLAAFHILPYLVDFAFDDSLIPGEQERSSPITCHFISHMHASSATAVPLPKLRSLSLTLLGTSFDDVAFTSMIASRWLTDPISAAAMGIDCFRSLVLRFRGREVDEKSRPLYDSLNQMGMQVVIGGKSMVITEA